MEYAIGVDLGGTNLRAAAIDRTGKLLEKIDGRTHLSEGRDAIVGDIVASIESLRSSCGRESLAGIGVAVPGFIRIEDGVIANSNNLACLENFPIRHHLETRLGAAVIFENDANAAAMGEKWMGAGRDVSDLVLVTLGTGVGGGVIYQGSILHGHLGMAGEIGHVTIDPNGYPCGCGNRGCLEKAASATAVCMMARILGMGELTAKQVYEAAKHGDERAIAVFNTVGEALGIAFAMLVNIFNFPLYLVGGGVVAAWDQFAPTMLAVARSRSFSFRTTNTRIAQATLADYAGLYGAAHLPWMRSNTFAAAGTKS